MDTSPPVQLARSSRTFVVEIRYREPTYEARHGARAEPYRFRYRVEASSKEGAIALAVRQFEDITALSSVGWSRDIVAIDVV